MSTSTPQYAVRAVSCDHLADDEVVYEALKAATAPLDRVWSRLQKAERIAIKFNQDKAPKNVVHFAGQRQQLVSDSVVRATVRLLREKTDAQLFCAEASAYVMGGGETVENTTNVAPILREFGVGYFDGTKPPYKPAQTPGGGLMFRQYMMIPDIIKGDPMVSVATIKNHAFMGITGCLKNLFGLVPGVERARPRGYYHHLVRMPYMLADIGRIWNPTLNIVDALVGQAGQEWGDGEGMARIVNALVAGDHVIATDACLAHLMGHDPQADWLTPPFHRDRNALLAAAESGFGTVDLDEIDFQSEVDPQPEGTFFAMDTDSEETTTTWRRTMCEQALYYRDNRNDFDAYAGEYILLQDGEVKWHSTEGIIRVSRRELSGDHPDHAMWFKFVDPDETEGEHYEVYERALDDLRDKGL